MTKKLPKFLKPYFWDVDFDTINPSKHRKYIAERILEHGDIKHVHWLFDNYSKKELAEIVRNTRALSKKSLNFWAMYFNIPKSKARCLKQPYLKMREAHWPY